MTVFANGLAHGAFDSVAHVAETMIDIIIRETQNTDAEHFNDLCSCFVIFLCVFSEMLTAVEFNNKLCGGTVKVGNERKDHRLSLELNRIGSKEIIP